MYRVIKNILLVLFTFAIPIIVGIASEIWIGFVVAMAQVVVVEAVCQARDAIIVEMRRLHGKDENYGTDRQETNVYQDGFRVDSCGCDYDWDLGHRPWCPRLDERRVHE